MPSKRLGFIEPMKAAVAPPPPFNGQWLYEVKYDGYRVLAVKNGKEVELWSRNKKRLDQRFPKVVEAITRLSIKNCILDGEVCALTDQGRSSFQLLQNSEVTDPPIVYYLFDILHNGSRDLCKLPLMERQKHLAKIMTKAGKPLKLSPGFTTDPGKVLEKMRSLGTEGAIAKLKASVYEPGSRSTSWIKIKFHKGQEFVIVGYTLPKNSRQHFGALLLGYYRKGKLIYAGRVGTGFNDRSLKEIHGKLSSLEVKSPMVDEIQEPSGRWRPRGWKASELRWVKPKWVAQIQFTDWTDDGILRHPSFLGLRLDKNPKEVVKES